MAPRRIEAFAPAKINLFLHVGDKRADGYHELESLAVFVDAGDRLVFEESETLSLAIEGPFGAGLSGEGDNLVLRAARALAAHAGIDPRAAITLKKDLPVASGIGGGSADAAAALRGLARLWDLDVGPLTGREIAETLGSDVPVCVESRPSWMDGRGEILTWALGIAPAWMVLVNPGVAVPTGAVFAALKTRTGVGKVLRIALDPFAVSLADFVRNTTNDLEAPALAIAPAIGDVLMALQAQKGALVARMSGSGATCFAIFDGRDRAEATVAAIQAAQPGWWVRSAQIVV